MAGLLNLCLCLLPALGAGRAAITKPARLAVKIEGAFSEADIALVKQIGDQADDPSKKSKLRNFGYGGLGHRVVYLHKFMDLKLRDRMMQLAREAENRAGWKGSNHLNLTARCMELIVYQGFARNESSTAWHYDGATLFTVAVMLTPRSSYEGGEVHFKRAGKQEGFNLEVGDALVWRGWNHHTVTPITAGERRVFVMELWTGVECGVGKGDRPEDSLNDLRVAIQVDNKSPNLYESYGDKLCTNWPCADAVEAEGAFKKYLKVSDIWALYILHPILSLIPTEWPICVFAKLQTVKVIKQMRGSKFVKHWVLPFLPLVVLLPLLWLCYRCCCKRRVQHDSKKKD